MAPKTLRCYAEGRDGDWEAICLDLDIAVQGASFEEVFSSLQEAISLYLESVADLPPQEQPGLLRRPAPFSIKFRFLTIRYARCSQTVIVIDSAISSPSLSPREGHFLNRRLGMPDCRIIEANVPSLMSSFSLWLDVIVLIMASDHHEPTSPPDTADVNAMASALPIQLKAVLYQDPNEVAKLHTL